MKRKNIYIILLSIYIITLGYMCFATPSNLPQIPNDWLNLPIDKVVHMMMFLPFPILSILSTEKKRYRVLPFIFIVGAVISILTEVIQKYLGYRCYELTDILADIIGLMIGILISALIIKNENAKNHN